MTKKMNEVIANAHNYQSNLTENSDSKEKMFDMLYSDSILRMIPIEKEDFTDADEAKLNEIVNGHCEINGYDPNDTIDGNKEKHDFNVEDFEALANGIAIEMKDYFISLQ